MLRNRRHFCRWRHLHRSRHSRPLAGEAIGAYAKSLWDAFPDLSFETLGSLENGDGLLAAEWLMKGTNTGSMNGLPPTGMTGIWIPSRLNPRRIRCGACSKMAPVKAPQETCTCGAALPDPIAYW